MRYRIVAIDSRTLDTATNGLVYARYLVEEVGA